MRFRVELNVFAGPFDLLLYLVRKHEVEVFDIPIAAVTEQYLEILAVIEQIDVDAVGDFLEIATLLMEIKSQMVLPRREDEEETEVDDPRADLVQRLLEYKRYKEAASLLEERGHEWQQRFARRANDSSTTPHDPAERPVQRIEIWDLVSAFSRVITEHSKSKPTKIRYDDTPIEVHMERISKRVARDGRLKFVELFEPGMHRSQLVGMLLAVLELMRRGGFYAEQESLFGDIWLAIPLLQPAAA